MHPSEVWILLAAALFIGGCAGWLLGHWRAYQECCECCTCQDCGGDSLSFDDNAGWPEPLSFEESRWPEPKHPRDMTRDEWINHFGDPRGWLSRNDYQERRHAVVLEPGPTIYPALAALAQEALDGSESHADGPDTSTWLRTWRLGLEAAYPIPGTPQWEARHTALQEA